MKKAISFILIMSMLLTLVLIPMLKYTSLTAETTGAFSVSYTLPTNMHKAKTEENWIAVNQETVKIVFTQAVDSESLSGITFKDAQGNDPKGGIYITSEGETVTVKFGELTQGTDQTYTLTVPTTVKSVNGDSLSGAVTRAYKVVNKKALVDVDFSDTSVWSVGALPVSSLTIKDNYQYGLFSSFGISSDIAKDLYCKFAKYSSTTNDLSITENGTLMINAKTGAGDRHIGGHYRSNHRLPNAKVVTIMTFPVPTYTNASGMGFGSLWTSSFGTASLKNNSGISYSTVHNANFGKTAKDYYDVTFVSNMEETALNGSKVTFTDWVTATDNISGKTISTEKLTKEDGGTSTVFSNTASALKIYNAGTVFEIATLKQGFYVFPQVLNKNGYEEALGAVTYTMNTDIDPTTLTNVKVNGNLVNATYDSQTRKIIVPFELENRDYDISLKGIKSVDGFSFEYEDAILNLPEITNSALRDTATNEVVSDILKANNLKFTFDYKNTEYEKNLQAIIAEYDGNILKNLKIENVVLLPNAEDTVEIPYTLVNKTTNMKIMATLWDMRRLVPVCSAISKAVSDEMIFEAENYDIISDGLEKIVNSTAVGGWTEGSYLAYEGITLTPYHTLFTAKLLPYKAGKFEIRANSSTGEVIGTIVIPEEDALFGKVAIDEASTSQYKEYDAVLDTTGIQSPFDLYIVCVDAQGCSSDRYEITPVDIKATEYSLIANTGFYLNPLTANKNNISVLDENENNYTVADVYYTPLTGENDGILEVCLKNGLSSISNYNIISSTLKDISGQTTDLFLDATLKYKLPQSDKEAYISDFYIAQDGDVVLNIENPTNGSYGILTACAVVLRDGEVLKEKTVKANLLDTDSVACEFNLDGYDMQSGDILKLFVYKDDLVHIKNSGFVFDIK